jgi:hypothetical protein
MGKVTIGVAVMGAGIRWGIGPGIGDLAVELICKKVERYFKKKHNDPVTIILEEQVPGSADFNVSEGDFEVIEDATCSALNELSRKQARSIKGSFTEFLINNSKLSKSLSLL